MGRTGGGHTFPVASFDTAPVPPRKTLFPTVERRLTIGWLLHVGPLSKTGNPAAFDKTAPDKASGKFWAEVTSAPEKP